MKMKVEAEVVKKRNIEFVWWTYPYKFDFLI
jgi:hypothetical protein